MSLVLSEIIVKTFQLSITFKDCHIVTSAIFPKYFLK